MGTIRTVEELKSLVDPLAVYQDYVRLTPRGKRRLGLCPFHKEKTPSFSVDGENGLFYCFGCHKGGDVIQFIREMESCDFKEAVEILAKKGGVTYEFKRSPGGRDQKPDIRERLRALMNAASSCARSLFEEAGEDSPVRRYCRRRGIDADTAVTLGLGFTPPEGGLLSRLVRLGFKAEECREAGLVIERRGGEWTERFRNRLLFPIRDTMGRTVGFGGRALGEEEPKYLNSPESPIFQKRSLLYGLDLTKQAAKERDRLVLVEGYMDFLAVFQAGVPNVAATLGTALAEGQIRLIKRYAREVVLNFDRDAAGLAAAKRAIQGCLSEDLAIKVILIPDGKDPDDFIRNHGPEAYAELLEGAVPFFRFLVDLQGEGSGPMDAAGKRAFLDGLAEYLASVADPIERQEYAKEVAGRLAVDPSLILKRLDRTPDRRHKLPEEPSAPLPDISFADQILVKGVLAFPEAAARLFEEVPGEAWAMSPAASLVKALLRTGRPEGPDQTRLLALIDNGCHEAPTEEDLANAVDAMTAAHLRRKEREIQQQIKEASLRKDFGLIQILNRQKMSVLEQIQSLQRQGS